MRLRLQMGSDSLTYHCLASLQFSDFIDLLYFQWCGNLRRFQNLRWPSVLMFLCWSGPESLVLSPHWCSVWQVSDGRKDGVQRCLLILASHATQNQHNCAKSMLYQKHFVNTFIFKRCIQFISEFMVHLLSAKNHASALGSKIKGISFVKLIVQGGRYICVF